MMNLSANILGVVLCLTGLIGFFSNEFLGMALNPIHSSILVLIGAVSLWFGVQGTEFQARNMCRTLGFVFGILGLANLFAGPGVATAGGLNITTDNLLKLIPGQLELTTADGIRNVIVGFVGLVVGFFPREKEIEVNTKFQERQRQMAGKP